MGALIPSSPSSANTLILSDETESSFEHVEITQIERYEDLGPIGEGGMAEVRRVRDRELDRILAMKIIHPSLLVQSASLARFLDEARATAQLQHPSIVPVYDLGHLPDGRVWFTMKEIQGRTLSDVIQEVHRHSTDHWNVTASGWSFRRLITVFHAICQAVAYAHEQGVIHRDLKPENAMVGRYGEVYVLDWGLAKRQEQYIDTGLKIVAGTPAYMSPEQARGEADAQSDVYALGAILYEILSGRPPYTGSGVLAQVLAGPPKPLGRPTIGFGEALWAGEGGPPLPEELVAACTQAMAREKAYRSRGAAALAASIQDWLDGSRLREQALSVVARAEKVEAEGAALLAQASALQAESVALLSGIPKWATEAQKAPGWAKAAEAETAALAARLKQLEVDELLRGAFQFVPDLPEAHVKLALRHQERHRLAEAARDRRRTAEEGTLLTVHAAALPERHPVRQALTAYLKGDGVLSLQTDPPGASIQLYRYIIQNHRLIEVFEQDLGLTPIDKISLPMGSYICVITHPDCEEIRYPVEVTRQGHWDGIVDSVRRPIKLLPRGFLGPEEVYVPAGWFRAGGDTEVTTSFPAARLWCDAFVMDRFPTTNRQYIAFLDDLMAQGREEEALRHAPRAAGGGGELGALIYGLDKGHFFLRPDADGDLWLPEWPVVMVSWVSAAAFLAWKAEKTHKPWRLPTELAWEKAARGVDGRWYPWGDAFDPSYCRMLDSARGREWGDFGPVAVDQCPVDCSPYGLRGMGGNVNDWCVDIFDRPFQTENPWGSPDTAEDNWSMRVIRGGSWDLIGRTCRAAGRGRREPLNAGPSIGFRGIYWVST